MGGRDLEYRDFRPAQRKKPDPIPIEKAGHGGVSLLSQQWQQV
jgi:hypothetical protein